MEEKLYKIYFTAKKVHIDLCRGNNVDPFGWRNNDIVYDSCIHKNFMYCTIDKIDACKKKLLNYLKNQELDTIKAANKNLEYLNQIVA